MAPTWASPGLFFDTSELAKLVQHKFFNFGKVSFGFLRITFELKKSFVILRRQCRFKHMTLQSNFVFKPAI